MTSKLTRVYTLSKGDMYGPMQPSQRLHWFRRLLVTLFWVAIILHLYALALRVFPVPATILMGQRALAGEDIRRDWVSLEDMSPHLPRTVIGAEDSLFCEHKGIDLRAIKSAFYNNKGGGIKRGGSTITQQTAKNVFLWNGGGYPRKAVEAWAAIYVNSVWGKRRTMEIYLNVAEWGDGIFGAEAASQARFGKPAKDLTKKEAALLAAVLPSPNKWRVDPPGPYVAGRADDLLKRAEHVKSRQFDGCLKR